MLSISVFTCVVEGEEGHRSRFLSVASQLSLKATMVANSFIESVRLACLQHAHDRKKLLLGTYPLLGDMSVLEDAGTYTQGKSLYSHLGM